MAGVNDYCQRIADALVAKNIRATTDPARISPPCVLVTSVDGEMTTLDGHHSRTAFLMRCIGPGVGAKNSEDALSALFAHVILANVAPVRQWRKNNVGAVDTGDQFPTYDLEWVLEVDVTAGVTP